MSVTLQRYSLPSMRILIAIFQQAQILSLHYYKLPIWSCEEFSAMLIHTIFDLWNTWSAFLDINLFVAFWCDLQSSI